MQTRIRKIVNADLSVEYIPQYNRFLFWHTMGVTTYPQDSDTGYFTPLKFATIDGAKSAIDDFWKSHQSTQVFHQEYINYP